jgi:hypothetical protein
VYKEFYHCQFNFTVDVNGSTDLFVYECSSSFPLFILLITIFSFYIQYGTARDDKISNLSFQASSQQPLNTSLLLNLRTLILHLHHIYLPSSTNPETQSILGPKISIWSDAFLKTWHSPNHRISPSIIVSSILMNQQDFKLAHTLPSTSAQAPSIPSPSPHPLPSIHV